MSIERVNYYGFKEGDRSQYHDNFEIPDYWNRRATIIFVVRIPLRYKENDCTHENLGQQSSIIYMAVIML